MAIIAVMIVVTGISIGALAAVGWVVAVANSAPNLGQLKPDDPHPLSAIYAADGALLGYVHSDTVFDTVPTSRIPQTLKEATVAIEDRRFYQHGGVDYQGLLRAAIRDVFRAAASQGGSTLTMQLVTTSTCPTIQGHSQPQVQDRAGQARDQLEDKDSKD